MNEDFKLRLMNCMEDFALFVRMNRDYEDAQFDKLKTLLGELIVELRNSSVIDKDIALNLYTLPQIVRNMFLSYDGPSGSRPEQFDRLEDAWIDLDALVIDCLQSPEA